MGAEARPRGFAWRLAAIAAGGLFIRVAYVLLVARDIGGSGDYFFYQSTANLIASGRGFADPFPLLADPQAAPGGPSAAHPPLWPLLLSVSSLAGATGEVAHKLVGCLVGTGAIAAVGLLGRRVGGDRIGLIAAALAAGYPVLIGADGALLSESLYGLLVALALLAAYALLDRPGPGRAALLGAVIGLAALTRSEGLGLLVLLVPLALVSVSGWGRRAVLLGVACVAAAAVLAPWTARNLSEFEHPVLISTNDGTLLAGANCDATYGGRDLGAWRFDCLTEGPAGEDESESGRRLREQGLEYARDHAGRLPLLAAVRVLRTWSLYQPLEQARFAEGRSRVLEQIGVGVFFLLVALGAVGLLTLRRRRGVLLLLAPAVLVTITSVIGYGVPRLRHAAEIPLLVLAAVGLQRLRERRSEAATSRPARASA